jgi:uncharacterized membrane protein YeiH
MGYIGDIAFVISGILVAKRLGLRPFWQFLSGMSTFCFGGIFIRDIGLLNTMPSIFGSPLEIAATAAVGIAAIWALRRASKKAVLGKVLSTALCVTDSIGIAGFTAFGYGRGMRASGSWEIALACALATAIGGGLVAAVIRSAASKDWRHFPKTLAGNIFYYAFAVLISAAYGALYTFGKNTDSALIALAIAAIVLGFIVEKLKSK